MTTIQSPSKDGARLVTYLLDGGGHDGSEQRNIYVDTIGLMPAKDSRGYIKQFRQEWGRASPRHTVQMRHMIYSPSPNEIPYNADNAEYFAGIVKEYIQLHYPNRRAIICIQQDGQGYTDKNGQLQKILHCHVALSDCDVYEYKGVEKVKTGFRYLAQTFDEFIKKRYGIQIDKGKDLQKRKYLQKQLKEVVEGEKDEHGKFIRYIDDIKDRISRCAMTSTSINNFYDRLIDFGLSVAQRVKKSGEEYQTYYLHDLSNISDSSKNRNGTLKKIAKKGQLPAMRSYKQEGFSIDEIEKMINAYTAEDSTENIEITKENIAENSPSIPTVEVDRAKITEALKNAENVITDRKTKEQKEKITKQRSDYAQAEFNLSPGKSKNKSL